MKPITELMGYELLGSYDSVRDPEPEETSYTPKDIRTEVQRRLALLDPSSDRNSKLSLQSVERPFAPRRESVVIAKYRASHSTAGGGGTNLRVDVQAEIETAETSDPNKVTVQLQMDEVKAPTLEDAFNKLAEWCERTALAIRHRKRDGVQIPL